MDTPIKDILQLDLSEDIKNVIDLEDQSEQERQDEIASYILTDGLAVHFSDFIKNYTSNIRETGVWISGFYGSGKSYFGKMLGHLLANPTINGTPARDRFLPRIRGVKNETWLENDILKLNAYEAKVVFLDIAKQNTENGLAFTLFTNFLKLLKFRSDLYGYIEFDLMLEGKSADFAAAVEAAVGKPWAEVKRSNRETARAVRQAHLAMGYSDQEYDDTKAIYEQDIRTFSAAKLSNQLKRYLEVYPDERIVFIFDEASEALSQQKFNLLDLEGISEALSSLGSQAWTIAIAQEKLDDVINNHNVSRSQLTKVTDRFKSKFHLESTEVDIIIQNRLLQKKEAYYEKLVQYYEEHEGRITDLTNLKSSFPTKTIQADTFATYFPFHAYQFQLLQKFLFSSNQLAASQIAARGMIITTFDVLRKQMQLRPLYSMATAHALCTEAQTAPPTELGVKYDHAKRILENKQSELRGDLLLKTIHFLSESELAPATLENITKSYLEDPDAYYQLKPEVEKALGYLVETKLLLPPVNQVYKITSDLEGKLLEEMNGFIVELFHKKRDLVGYLKKTPLFRPLSTLQLDELPYSFYISTHQGDEIVSASQKALKLAVYNLYNVEGDRQEFVEGVKLETQHEKGKISLVPQSAHFAEIDQLLAEIRKFTYLEEKYGNDSDQNKRRIVSDFTAIKSEKEQRLLRLLREAYETGSAIYLFDEYLLTATNFRAEIEGVQTKVVQNIYTKRLGSQLSDTTALRILKEKDASRLQAYCSGADFQFFDGKGNFVGDHLKVVEAITAQIDTNYLDGRSLEETIREAPWGYSYGTLATTLAALLRAGKLVVKYGGANNQTQEYFSYRDQAVQEVFTNSTKFKKAAFKSVTKTLSAGEKNIVVQALLDLDYQEHTGEKVDWNSSDFALAEAIKRLAEHFLTILGERRRDLTQFEQYFPKAAQQKSVLQAYTVKTTEANYLDKVQQFLAGKEAFVAGIEAIIKARDFIRRNLDKLRGFENFLANVSNELQKAGIEDTTVAEATAEYQRLKAASLVDNFAQLRQQAQRVKDAYYQRMKAAAQMLAGNYQELAFKVTAVQAESAAYPAELNRDTLRKLESLLQYAKQRSVGEVKLEYHIVCQNTGFSLSDMLNYLELHPKKETDLLLLQSSLVKEEPAAPPAADSETKTASAPTPPRELELTVPQQVMTVKAYRQLLAEQLQALAGIDNDELIKVNLK